MITKTELLAEYKLQADNGDKWDSALSFMFDICFFFEGNCQTFTPDNWEFQASAFGAEELDDESHWLELFKDTDLSVLEEVGNIFNRYIAKLRTAGEDY